MSHVYTNTVPKFDRQGFSKQCLDSELDNHERQILMLMAVYAAEDKTIPFQKFNGQNIGTKLSLSSSTVGRVLQRLKAAALLTKRMKGGRMFWVLPSEERIVSFSPKRK